MGGLQEGLGAAALQAQSLQGLPLAVEGLVDWDDVVRLSRGCFDGRAAQSAEPLLLQQQLPHVAPVPARLQERGEDLAGGRGQALTPVAEVQLGHPPLEHLRVFGILVHDAVAALGPQAQVPPLHQAAHRDLRLVPLPQQLCPDHAHVLAPEVPGLDLSAPLLPLPEEGHGGLAPIAAIAGLVPRLAVAEGHGAGVAVEEGVIAVDAAALPQLGHPVVAVRLQAAHQLLGAAPEVDVVVGAVAHELLVLVEAPGGRPATRELVVELTGPRRLPIRSTQQQLLPAGQAQEL